MTDSDLDQLTAAAKAAWIFGLPLIEITTTRGRSEAMGAPSNVFNHVRKLADHRARMVTTPNNDTLYSSAQVDLGQGPVTITLPATGDRYFSLALMDAYTNNFAILGTRTTGPDGGTFKLIGPNDAAEGDNIVRSPTRHVWALARILVDGPHDMEAAQAVQQGLSMQGPAGQSIGPTAKRSDSWAEYFAGLGRLMAVNPPPFTDLAALRAMAPLRLADFDAARFSPAQVAAIEAGIAEARIEVRKGGLDGGGFTGGWSYPNARLGDFGQDYGYRAGVALGGLAALPPVEAMYMRAKGDLPRALFDGLADWRLHFPADQLLPVNSFWSLSLYEATDDGQFFFTDNPLNRYAIGDRTEGLKTNADGSLDIWIGHASPGADRETNWLPAPPGPFALFMRAYLPKPALLDGRYRLPDVARV
jgi:hypothetical protein